MTANGNIL